MCHALFCFELNVTLSICNYELVLISIIKAVATLVTFLLTASGLLSMK